MTYTNVSLMKNIQTVVTQHTTVQSTSNSANTYTTIDGSEITYTPDPSSSNVVYEIGFYGEKSGITFMCGELQIADVGNTNWTEVNAKYRKNTGNLGSISQKYRYYINWKFIIPSWIGSKQLRLQTASNATNRNINLHQVTEWDGSNSSNTFCNTNLIVYSI
jgi:hypothetical protein